MASTTVDRSDWRLGELGGRTIRVAAIVGVVGLVSTLALAFAGGGGTRVLQSWLVAFCYFLSLSLGAMFFVLIQHLVGASWSVVVRRQAESIAANLPLLALFFVPILLGLGELYPWARPEAVAADPLLQHKAPYLNLTFFIARWVFYFVVWTLISRYFLGRSLRQDREGGVAITLAMEKTAAPSVIGLAITTSFAGLDLLMTLSPTWYSTIFGVYFFAGGFLGCFALLAVISIWLQSAGKVRTAITPEHYHDLGKLIFAFTIFWAYIGFSQFMLIWYSNIPEETVWYRMRIDGSWEAFSYFLLFAHFVIPFCGLLSRTAKRRTKILGFWAVWMLVMHYVDLYWVVMPGAHAGRVPYHLADLTSLLGMGGLFVAAAAWRLRDQSLIPERDPRLPDSLAFENA